MGRANGGVTEAARIVAHWRWAKGPFFALYPPKRPRFVFSGGRPKAIDIFVYNNVPPDINAFFMKRGIEEILS